MAEVDIDTSSESAKDTNGRSEASHSSSDNQIVYPELADDVDVPSYCRQESPIELETDHKGTQI